MLKRIGLLATTLAIAGALNAGPAVAAPQQMEEPLEEYLNTTSVEVSTSAGETTVITVPDSGVIDQDTWEQLPSPVTLPALGPIDAALGDQKTCNHALVSMTGKNVLDMKLWTYYQKIMWCYNNDSQRIVEIDRSRWGDTHFLFWEFVGHIQNDSSGGDGHYSYSASTTGHFRWCFVTSLACIQHQYPKINMTVQGNGGWSYSVSGP